MAYNEKLADKLRQSLAGTKNLVEKKMFGGIALMINDKMCAGVYKDDIILRCVPEQTDNLLTKKGAKPFDLSGKKSMAGWLLISPDGWTNKKDFDYWLTVALDANKKATSSPTKKKK
ncbi:MAG: TfoX/Sxy family protein [Bacteroidetes bacterium]|nr:TfoX/Sxy family protein [Bacteroidota bacterium]